MSERMVYSELTTECRSRSRYKLALELKFSYRRGKNTYHGTGRTIDFSDKAICFETDHEVPGGVQVELSIAWPVCLQGFLPLDMIVHGALVRRQSCLAVVRLEDFAFRTRGEGIFHDPATQGSLYNLLA